MTNFLGTPDGDNWLYESAKQLSSGNNVVIDDETTVTFKQFLGEFQLTIRRAAIYDNQCDLAQLVVNALTGAQCKGYAASLIGRNTPHNVAEAMLKEYADKAERHLKKLNQ